MFYKKYCNIANHAISNIWIILCFTFWSYDPCLFQFNAVAAASKNSTSNYAHFLASRYLPARHPDIDWTLNLPPSLTMNLNGFIKCTQFKH